MLCHISKVWDAAMRTSAAPTFFPVYRGYTDGMNWQTIIIPRHYYFEIFYIHIERKSDFFIYITIICCFLFPSCVSCLILSDHLVSYPNIAKLH